MLQETKEWGIENRSGEFSIRHCAENGCGNKATSKQKGTGLHSPAGGRLSHSYPAG